MNSAATRNSDRCDIAGGALPPGGSIRRTYERANLVSASLENCCLAKADLEFVLMAEARCGAPACMRPDMSGAQLDIRTEEAYLARYLWALLKGVRATATERWNHDPAKLPRSLP